MKDSFCPQIRFFCKTEFSFCADFFFGRSESGKLDSDEFSFRRYPKFVFFRISNRVLYFVFWFNQINRMKLDVTFTNAAMTQSCFQYRNIILLHFQIRGAKVF